MGQVIERQVIEARGEDRPSLYKQVTDKIVGELEAGRVPWVQPWGSAKAGLGLPQNAASARRYSGINVLFLWGAVIDRGFEAQSWLTFRQALALGGHVRKGEAGTMVVYADRFVPKDKSGGEPVGRRHGSPACGNTEATGERPIPFLKRFTVFNIDQCEGLPDRLYADAPPVLESLILPEAEALIRATGAKFRIGGEKAYYMPGTDSVHVPPPQAFFEPINWHRTACHELSHWTGHTSRLARDQSGLYGSKAYAREELVAEMAGAFVCASLNIVPTVRHADYLGEWLSILREDSRAIFRAASAASKAADYLLAFRHVDQPAAGCAATEEASEPDDASLEPCPNSCPEISPQAAEPQR
ncbi:MAG: zincin-like metallopeptidase domain-containing protein [Micropepsaceae bacterium]